MESWLSALIAITAGISMASLSYVFFNPLSGDLHGGGRKILRSVVSVWVIGIMTMITTSSLQTAVVITAIPAIFCIAFLFSHSRYKKKRQFLIARELPLLLDYMVLQVESGHSIQQALRSASGLFIDGGPLYSGLNELEESIQVGCSIDQALDKLGRWLDTSEAEAPIMAISQAIQHGTPLGKVLREQSKRMREFLILEGEQFANTVSVKILIPLLFFIFPASFLVIFSPVIVSLSGGLP